MSRLRHAYKAKRARVILIESAIRGYLARKHTKPDLEKRMQALAEDESRMPPAEQARRQKLREEEAKKVIKVA
jgi:predicted transcriptional regulator